MLITMGDLQKVAPLWLAYGTIIHKDAEANKVGLLECRWVGGWGDFGAFSGLTGCQWLSLCRPVHLLAPSTQHVR